MLRVCLQVIKDMEKVRNLLTKPQNLRVHLAVHAPTAANSLSPQAPWIEEMLPKDCDTGGDRSAKLPTLDSE